MRIEWSAFENELLERVCRAFARRSKPIIRSGRLDFQAGKEEDLEWIWVAVYPRCSPCVELKLVALRHVFDVSADIYVRRTSRKKHGQTIFFLRDLLLSCRSSDLVGAFEWTLDQRYPALLEARELWESLAGALPPWWGRWSYRPTSFS